MSILDRARPEIRALTPYQSARSTTTVAPILLNANENPWPAPGGGDSQLNRYPDPQPAALVEALADRYQVSREQLLVTRGSDEAIDLLVRAFCRAYRDTLICCPPTFGMYRVAARIQGAAVREVPLDAARAYALDPAAVIGALDDKVRLVFLCSPNNPTGDCADLDSIIEIVEAARDRALVVVDEAYLEFARVPSLAGRIDHYDNLAVLRTLSKAYALAGARCGALVAAPGVVSLLRRILAPYPLPTPTVTAALAALRPDALQQVEQQVGQIIAARDQLAQRLARYPVVHRVLPSQANFLLVGVTDGPRLLAAAAAAGIALRDMSGYPGLANHVRISIGAPGEMFRLYELLDDLERTAT